MNPDIDVCAVVVTYNRLELLKDAVSSLKKQDYPCDILVIDNGSNDGTKEYLDREVGVSVIHQDNVGGAGGFFTGMKRACELGYKFVWIMDDDVIPERDALSAIVKDYEFISSREEVGFICSQVLSEKGFTANVPKIDMSPNETGYADWAKYLEKGIIRVKAATFVSVFIPCKRIFELGLPYKDYFIWGDDTEYTQRLSTKYGCFMTGNSHIVHRRIGGSLDIRNINNPYRIKMFRKYIRNNIHNHVLYESKMSTIKFVVYYILLSVKELFKGNLDKTKTLLIGILDSLHFNPKIEFPNIQ